MLVAATRDTRLMTVYSYTRLIVYDDKFKLHADILESYEVKEGREFTLKLRAGHKWSDGHPFTTEDFRFFWEDVANNKDLSPNGPSVELLVDGQPPKVEIIDEVTIRYSWDKPNPDFIESQARAAPSSCSGRPTTSRRSTASTRPRRRSSSATRAAAGPTSSSARTRCTATATSTCRRSTRGSSPRCRPPSASSSCATPTSTASTARASSCPTSTT